MSEEGSAVRPIENIVLDYPIVVLHGDSAYYGKPGAEVFQDEHGVQWIKFIAKNGYHSGSEHMLRTVFVIIVRDDK